MHARQSPTPVFFEVGCLKCGLQKPFSRPHTTSTCRSACAAPPAPASFARSAAARWAVRRSELHLVHRSSDSSSRGRRSGACSARCWREGGGEGHDIRVPRSSVRFFQRRILGLSADLPFAGAAVTLPSSMPAVVARMRSSAFVSSALRRMRPRLRPWRRSLPGAVRYDRAQRRPSLTPCC